MSLIKGTWLGPYEILGALGAGGMGEVYRGRDTKLERDVALKILRTPGPDSSTYVFTKTDSQRNLFRIPLG